MSDSLTQEFAIWLPNPRREWWLPLFMLGSTVLIVQVVANWRASVLHFWLGIGSWGVVTIMLYNRFAKWASNPATAVVSAEGLTISSEATGYRFAASYAAVKACTYGIAKGSVWLRIDYPNGTKVLLRSVYKQNTFGKMATSCERYYEAYWLQIRLNQPRARR